MERATQDSDGGDTADLEGRATRSTVARPLQVVAHSDQVSSPTAIVRLAPGRIVPGTHYRITRWLGEGGMGVIYEARHVEVQRKVALKVIREDRLAADATEKFRHEARTASSIGSEFIVEVYDLDTLPDGRMVIALELIDGHDLFEELASAPMALPRFIAILRQVAKGLAAAHAVGVVHRDIKPENILVTHRRRRPDAVKIVDFGISRVRGTQAQYERRGVGTPAYMAPERWAGEPFEGPSVDIYAVGCLAYELLVGRPPFVGSTNAVMLAHFEQSVPRLADARPGLYIPEPIERVIRRCLEKRPEDRFASMNDFEAALCEAQIAAGIETSWDDLPLPEVDEARHDALLRGMPSPEVVKIVRPSLRWAGGILVLAFLTMSAMAWSIGVFDPDSALHARTEIDDLTERAKLAAARASWVYPAAGDDPETAYRWVLALEERGDAASLRRAHELRAEFAQTLSRIGDRYWDRDGGRVFAVDYYAQALIFAPDDLDLKERARLTPGEFATLRAKAAELEFTEDERQSVLPLVFLASEDERQVVASLRTYLETGKQRSLSEILRIEALVEHATPSSSTVSTPSTSEAEPLAPQSVSEPKVASRTVREASALVDEARRSLAKGQRDRAEKLYHRALSADRFNSAALIGLSNLHFDRADYYKAMEFAARAVRVQPRNASYHVTLGDAYYRLLRYNDARRHYVSAQRLGHRQAKARLGKLDRKMGAH